MTARKPSAAAEERRIAQLTAAEDRTAFTRVTEIPVISQGDVVTLANVDYYVYENFRQSLELVRLRDLKDGFRANIVTHKVKAGRKATEEERSAVMGMMLEKLNKEASYRTGAVVRFLKSTPKKGIDATVLYVITGTNDKTVSVTKLGGDAGGAYVRCSRDMLEVVKLEDVLK